MDARTDEKHVGGKAPADLADRTGLASTPDRVEPSGREYWADRSAQLERAAHLTSAREQLRVRQDGLPPGHPSSPLNADGSPRPPVPRLAELDHADQAASPDQPPDPAEVRDAPEPPLSDAEYAEHVSTVAAALEKARADGFATDKQFTINPDRDIWDDHRSATHDAIIEELYARNTEVPCERRAIIAGGLGGAGKTTTLELHAGIDRTQYLTVNPDTFKEELAKRGLVPELPGLSPMEASNLVHEESSYLARRLANRALAEGKNLIWDITMSSPSTGESRVDQLRAAGYREVVGVFVDIPVDVSIARTQERHRRGHDQFIAGLGLGGRYLPEDVMRAQFDPNYGTINRRAFEMLKGRFDSWMIYDNSADGRPPVLVGRGNNGRSETEDRESLS